MPLSRYYGGKGARVMREMKDRYGDVKGERVFYATENKRKRRGSQNRERMIRDFMRHR